MLRFSYVPPQTASASLQASSALDSDRPFASVQSVLPSIGITKRRLKQLQAVHLIREQRDQNNQELAYHARPFVLCGIPLRCPPRGQTSHTRRNGRFFLEVTAHPRFGLPFGQDRLIPIWVATLALRQKNRVVQFKSAAQMLEFFRLPQDGYHYRRIVQGFQRIFAATIFFGTEEQPGGNTIIDWARFHFFDRMQLWFNTNGDQPTAPSANLDNVITLSEAFYKEIDEHRIPVEREVVAALANAPGVLDFYLWMAWKSWSVKSQPAPIPLVGIGGLNEQLGTKEYSLQRRFRHTIVDWLRKVKAFWPECPASISKDRQFLIVSSSKRSPAINPVRRALDS